VVLYLHVFNWPKDGRLLVPGLKNAVESALVLASGAKLEAKAAGNGVALTVPDAAPDAISSTIVLKVKGTIEVEQAPSPSESPLQTPDAEGTLKLPAAAAKTHGASLKHEARNDNLGYWTKADDWAEWSCEVTKPGKFTVSAHTASTSSASFDVIVGAQRLRVNFPRTGNYTTYQTTQAGTLELSAGRTTLSIKPVKEGWRPVNLKWLKLTPQK
jgi:alpha-L-fucosidase